MSKQNLADAINSWLSGQCRKSTEEPSHSFTESDIKVAAFCALKIQAEESSKSIELIEKDMHLLDLFRSDCFLTKAVGVEFPFHNYPDANQDFLKDVVLYLKGEITELHYEDYI